ncbi:unnamed protein product [Alopecurus aequalis]
MSKYLLSLLRMRGKDGEKSKEQRYDPRCGMPREEYEWRCARAERVDQRMPQLLEKLDVLLRTMLPHFLNDPSALKKWDAYEKDVRYAFNRNLRGTLMAPVYIPNSVAYEQLMKRNAWSRTLVGRVSGGLEKLKQAATRTPKRNKRSLRTGVTVAGVAAAFAIGIAVGRIQLKESSKQKLDKIERWKRQPCHCCEDSSVSHNSPQSRNIDRAYHMFVET